MRSTRLATAPLEPLQYLQFGVDDGSAMIAAVRAFESVGRHDATFVGFDDFSTGRQGASRPASRAVCEWHLARHGFVRRVRLVEGGLEQTCLPELAEELGAAHVVRLGAVSAYDTEVVLDFVTPILADPAIVIVADWFVGGGATGARRATWRGPSASSSRRSQRRASNGSVRSAPAGSPCW